MAEVDISKVIGLIMENPKLLDEIKSLAVSEEQKEAPKPQTEEAEIHTQAQIPPSLPQKSKSNRAELLDALKPYISDERKKAIESFVTIAEILEVMRAK